MTGVIIQARMSSTRLPGKVMRLLAGEPVLYHVVERVKRTRGIDTVIVATTVEKEDDAIVRFCEERGYANFRGSRDDVLSRYLEASHAYELDEIVRITSDCPLVDPDIVSELLERFHSGAYDYMSNFTPGERTFPRGLDCEVCTYTALEKAHAGAHESYEREHVTPFMYENKTGEFTVGPMLAARGIYARPRYRLTLDYDEDYRLFEHLYDRFYKKGDVITVPDVLTYLDEHPNVAAINAFRDAEYPTSGIRK